MSMRRDDVSIGDLDDDPCERANTVLADPASDELARRRAADHRATCPLCQADQRKVTGTPSAASWSTGHVERFEPPAFRRGTASQPERWCLGTLAVVQLLLGAPWLFGSNPLHATLGVTSTEHLARDGALGVTMAVAGLVTAWRSRYAFAVLTLVGAVMAMQVVAGIADARSGHVHFEWVHILAALIAVVIVRIALRPDRLTTRAR